MSSTNRGSKRSEADFYATPPYCVRRLLEDPYAADQLRGGRWLEPGAGEGSIIRTVNSMRTNIVWTALELRPEAKTDLIHAVGPHGTVVIEDYIEPPPNSELSALSRISPGFAVALGNPPYRLAAEFIQRSLEVAQTVCLLLRVNFLASARRNEFMRSHVPDTYIIPNRPSFSGTGTDSPEYAWLIWTQDKREVGQLRILNTTSIEERKADKKKSKIITDETKIPTDYLVTESPT